MKASVLTYTTIVSAVVWLFLAGESVAATPGLGTGLPDDLGPFNVGHTTIHVVGTGTLGEPRPIDVEVWYPADTSVWAAASPSEYSSRLRGVTLVPAKWDPLSWVLVSNAAREAPAFDKHGAFPVVLFSHGSTASPVEYVRTIEHIASHGYVVAAPWYNGDTQDDVRVQFINASNGAKVLDCLDNRPAPCLDPAAKNVADRARDLSTVLDALPAAFGDNLDMNQVFAMGHSRGTVTSLGAAGGSGFFDFAPEPRVKAVLGLAGAMGDIIFKIDLNNVTLPTVLIAGENDGNTLPAISETAFGTISS